MTAQELVVASPSGEHREAAQELDIHHVPDRYPDAHPEGSPFEFYRGSSPGHALAYLEGNSLNRALARRDKGREALIQEARNYLTQWPLGARPAALCPPPGAGGGQGSPQGSPS